MDVKETDKEIVVETELPGIDEKDVSLALQDGVLTIRGEKKHEHDEEKENYRVMNAAMAASSDQCGFPTPWTRTRLKQDAEEPRPASAWGCGGRQIAARIDGQHVLVQSFVVRCLQVTRPITNQISRSRFIKWRETVAERAPTEEKRVIWHEPTDTEVALRGAVA
jgi:hypothetical protein